MSYFEGLHEQIILFDDIITHGASMTYATSRANPQALEQNILEEQSTVPEYSTRSANKVALLTMMLLVGGLYCVWKTIFKRHSKR